MLQNREKALILVMILFACTGFFVLQSYKNLDERYAEQEKERINYLTAVRESLDGLSLEAQSVSVYDFTINEKIYAKNDTTIMPLASLTKLVSIPLALKNAPENLVIPLWSIKTPGDDGLIPGDTWNKYDLAKFALVLSSNDATMALTGFSTDIVEKMNNKAKYFWAKNTTFLNPTGLDINTEQVGAQGTAEDVNWLAYFALHTNKEIFNATTKSKVSLNSASGKVYEVKNTNTVTAQIPNLLLSKTGYTNLTGGNLVIIFKNKSHHEIAVTILGSSYEGRFTDMVKIVGVLYNY